MAKQNLGYLLPDGEAFTEDLACMILFYPDKREYRQALFGSLDGLSQWLNWERDDDKRGKDAALAWKLANIATRECLSMNTCETILSLLTSIEFNTRQCCGETTYTTYQNNVVVTTVIVPGSGGAPTYWGEEEVTDWDDWYELVCGAAHSYVDDLIDTAEKMHIAATVGGYVLDFIAHLFSIVQWRMVEDIIPVNFSMIQLMFDSLGQAGIQNEFDDVADNIELGREDIVCALINGTSLEDAVEAAVDNTVIWDAFFSWFDYDSTTAAIYNGEVDTDFYLPVLRSELCDCEITYTPTDLDIMAICWTYTFVGQSSAGVGSSDPMPLWMSSATPPAIDEILKGGDYYGPEDGTPGIKHTFHSEDAPEGFDDLSPSYLTEVPTEYWEETDEKVRLKITMPGSGEAGCTLSDMKVFVDTGSGYEWLDGYWTFIEKSSGKWLYNQSEQTLTAYISSGPQSNKSIKFLIEAQVPD